MNRRQRAHTASIFTLVAFRTIVLAVLCSPCSSFVQTTLGFALTHPQDFFIDLGLCHELSSFTLAQYLSWPFANGIFFFAMELFYYFLQENYFILNCVYMYVSGFGYVYMSVDTYRARRGHPWS